VPYLCAVYCSFIQALKHKCYLIVLVRKCGAVQRSSATTIPRYNEHFVCFSTNSLERGFRRNEPISPVLWHFVQSRFYCTVEIGDLWACGRNPCDHSWLKAIEQYFSVVLFIMLRKIVVSCESVDEILRNETENLLSKKFTGNLRRLGR